jgi:transposase
MRLSLIKFRTMQVNQLRGLRYEWGVTLKGGRQGGLAKIQQRMAELEEIIPGMLFEAVKEQLKRLDGIKADVQNIERRIKDWQKQQAACRKIAEIPGVGMLTATALVATLGARQITSSLDGNSLPLWGLFQDRAARAARLSC